MSTFVSLTQPEELALRQIGSQAISIDPDAARLLVRRGLAERYRDGLRLTSLGRRCYEALPKSPLQGRKPRPVIESILKRGDSLGSRRGHLEAGT